MSFIDYNFYLDDKKHVSKNDIEEFFIQIGVAIAPRIEKQEYRHRYNLYGILSDRQKSQLGDYNSTKGWNIIDYNIDGLKKLLDGNITLTSSIYLWEILGTIQIEQIKKGVTDMEKTDVIIRFFLHLPPKIKRLDFQPVWRMHIYLRC